MATYLATNTADFSSSDSPKKLLISNAVTLRQYLDIAETCDALPDETNALNVVYVGTGVEVTLVSGKWRFTVPSAAAETKRISLTSNTVLGGATAFGNLTGDFDVQIDFANLSQTGTLSNDTFVRLIMITNGSNYVAAYRMRIGTTDKYRGECISGGSSILDASVNTSDAGGKLRITRTGNVVHCYYWNGSSWTELGAGAAGASTADGELGITCNNLTANTGNFTVDVDNLTINSGTKVNWYYRDSPSFACTELDTGGTEGTVDKSTFNSTFTGTGSREYRWKSANSSGGGSFSAWLTQAGMTGASGPTGLARYWNFEGRLISDGTQTASDDAITINYTVGSLPPGGYWYWQQVNARRRQSSLVGV